MKLLFLGTGGGRYVTATQKRATGGIVLEEGKFRALIDPGPCSICRILEKQVNPRFDALLISHKHTDHSTGAPAVIEAMTGMTREKRGVLVCPPEISTGENGQNPMLPEYYLSLLSEVRTLQPGDSIEINGIKIRATPTHHGESKGIGFVFNETLAYISDTGYFPELTDAVKGVPYIIINLIGAEEREIPVLMTPPSAVRLLKETKPKKAIITHFGMNILRKGPENIARKIQEETGVRIITAKDGLEIDLNKRGVMDWA